MVRHVDAIFTEGAFRPLEPFALRDGTRVHLSIEEETPATFASHTSKLHTPKLAHSEDVADFVMEVQETGDARL